MASLSSTYKINIAPKKTSQPENKIAIIFELTKATPAIKNIFPNCPGCLIQLNIPISTNLSGDKNLSFFC